MSMDNKKKEEHWNSNKKETSLTIAKLIELGGHARYLMVGVELFRIFTFYNLQKYRNLERIKFNIYSRLKRHL